MDKCVYPECLYHGLVNKKFHKCELHQTMCDYVVDGKHICKLFSVTHYTYDERHQLKYEGYYCEEHSKMRCSWESYYGTPCENQAIEYSLCAEHICIIDDCRNVVHETEAESYLINDGYCKTHYVGDRVKSFH